MISRRNKHYLKSQTKKVAPRIVKFIETESEIAIARGWGQEGMGSYCLMGIECQYGMMNRFWR